MSRLDRLDIDCDDAFTARGVARAHSRDCRRGAAMKSHVVRLTCCVCGSRCQGRQWWNRDAGYGLCGPCAHWLTAVHRTPAAEMVDLYGHDGRHYFLKSTEVET